ncbi:hypothetical protein GQ43DRAFT_475084 [Delitschia confertaspora ATCC 74209]|uniref:Rhodopsin domain-containing protein n=1 Tax=Delitschia confertaspora ATCC 74209 TaxID=1513339 RepID=A0A9P4MSA7_9PLEO|nr:hypothetical protein GQ43DRAFT_475084 [Delitschia confertaspora ATCC 74209]
MLSKETVALVACTVLMFVSWLFLSARFYVRYTLHKIGNDDWLCLLAVIFGTAELVLMGFEVRFGAGKRSSQVSLEDAVHQRQMVYVSMVVYYLTLMWVKLSIGFTFKRFITPFTNRFRAMLLNWTLGVVVVSTFTFVFLSLFQCSPPQGFWDLSVRTRCPLSLTAINSAFTVVHAITDTFLFFLPLGVFRRLQMNRTDKSGLILTFSLAASTIVITFCRTPFVIILAKGVDPIFYGWGMIVWSRIEISVAIICACIPSCRCPSRWLPQALSRWVPGFFRSWCSLCGARRQHGARQPVSTFGQDHADIELATIPRVSNSATSDVETGRPDPPLDPRDPYDLSFAADEASESEDDRRVMGGGLGEEFGSTTHLKGPESTFSKDS